MSSARLCYCPLEGAGLPVVAPPPAEPPPVAPPGTVVALDGGMPVELPVELPVPLSPVLPAEEPEVPPVSGTPVDGGGVVVRSEVDGLALDEPLLVWD